MKRSTVIFLVAVLILLTGGTAFSQAPAIAFDPEAINFGEVLVGEQAVEVLTIINAGDAPLAISDIEVAGDGFSAEFEGGGGGEPAEFDWEFNNTDNNHSFLVQEANIGEDLVTPDNAIGVFTGEGMCAGFSIIVGYPCGVAAWGDEAQQQGIQGFLANEVVNFRIFDMEAGIEYAAEPTLFQDHLGIYAPNGFSVVTSLDATDILRGGGGGGGGEPAEFDWEFNNTDNNHSFLVQEANIGEDLVTPDNAIGVFTGEGMCAGFSIIVGYPCGVAAWGDEAQQQGIQGFLANEVVNFRIFDMEAGIEYAAEPTLFQDHLGIYAPNGFSVVTSLDATDILRGGDQGGGDLVIEPDGSYDLPVTFAPNEEGEYEGVLTVFSDDPDNPEAEVDLFGVGFAERFPQIHLFVEEMDFGEVEVGTSALLALAIRNDGDAVLEVDLSVIEGDYFRPAGVNISVNPGAVYGAGAYFEPEEEGEFRGVLRVASNDPDNPELFVDLLGQGVIPAPEIFVNPMEIDFGAVIVGETADDAFVITNVGEAPLAIGNVYTNDDGFAVDFEGGGGEPAEFDWEFNNTDNNHSFLVQEAYIGEDLVTPDNAIGVFTGEGMCAGFSIIVGYPCGVAAWGDEAQQQGIQGFLANEVVNFRIFDMDAGIEYAAEPTLFQDHLGIYAPNGFSVVTHLEATDILRGGGGGEVVLEPDEELQIPVHFAPEEVREYEGVVIIESSDENNPEVQVALSGLGVAEDVPDIELNAMEHDFGQVIVGERAEEWGLIITNAGEADLMVVSATLSGDYFYGDEWENQVVRPGGQLEVSLGFAPEESGAFEGYVDIVSNDPDEGELRVTLSGVGIGAPQIAVPEVIDFGEVLVGEQGEDVLVIGNDGGQDLTVDDIAVEGDGFSVDFNGGGGEPAEFDWEFNNTDNNHSFLVQEAYIGEDLVTPDNAIGVFTGEGMCAGFSIIVGYPCGVAAWGDEAQQQGIQGFLANEVVNFRIFDMDAGIEYAAEPTLFQDHLGIYAPNGFSVVTHLEATDILRGGGGGGEPVVIGPGEEIEVPVYFNPERNGEHAGLLTVFSDDPNNGEAEVGLVGVGVFNPPVMTLSDLAFDFGEVAVGDFDTRTLTITNEGGQDLEVQLVVAGDYFSIVGENQYVIGFEQSVDVPILFTPGERGALDGVLAVNSNDPNNEEVLVELSGVGLAPIIAIDNEALDFGEVFVGNGNMVEATLSNRGDATLVIADWNIDSDDFTVEVDFQQEFNWEYDRTDNGASVLVVDAFIGQNLLEEGDAIGVFTPAGLCCGYTIIAGDYPVGIAVWGDEAQRPGINGFVDGEEILYRFWDADPGREHRAHAEYEEGEDGEYHPNGFYVAHLTEGRMEPMDLEQPIILEAGEEVMATVIFTPSEAREYNNTWYIQSNDPATPEFEVGLHGVGLPVNRSPEWVEVPPDAFEWPEGELLQGGMVAIDPDEDELELWLEDLIGNLPEEAVFQDNGDGTGTFTWDVGFMDAGEYHIVGYCSDGLITIETHTMITVLNVNLLPVWDEEFYDVQGYENDLIEFTVVALDPDLDNELTVTMDGDLPQELFQDNGDGTGTVTWQTGYDDAGTYNLEFTVNDGFDDVVVGAQVEVINVNRAPEVANPIRDVEIGEDSGLNLIANLDEVFFDPDGDRLMYFIVNLDDLEGYGLDIDERNNLTATPEENFNGSAEVILNADDGANDVEMVVSFNNQGQQRQASRAMRSVIGEANLNRDEDVDHAFTLTVIPVNDTPYWDEYPADPFNVQETDVVEFDVIAMDVDGDDLRIGLSGEGIPEDALTDNGNGQASFYWETGYEDAGNYVAVITVSDGQEEDVVNVEINITNLNRDCFWVDPIDSYGGSENNLIEFTMVGDDPDVDDRLVLTMSSDDLPDGDWFTDNGDGTGDFSWPTGWYDAGVYNANFMLTDGEAEVYHAVEINVGNVNRDPALEDVDPIRVDEGSLIEFTLTVNDPDADDALEIGYSDMGGLPDEAALTDNGDGTADFSWQTDFFSGGTYNPTFYVDDGYTTAELEVTINVDQVLQHFTEFQITNVNHSVIVGSITFEDEVVPTGWEVGVFTPADLLCGGQIWVNDGEGIGIAAWGDVAGDQEIQGFLPGERMNFRVWDDVADEEYNALAEVSDGSIFWQSNGLTSLTLSVSGMVEQVVEFREGWNIISINVVPGPQYWRDGEDRGADIVMMLEQLDVAGDDPHHVILIKNDIGDFYAPRIPFNNLRYWDNYEGYYMNVDFEGLDELSATWEGTQIAADADLPVPNGWCFIPYYPTYELIASRPSGYYVLSPIIDYVVRAKNTLGDFMAPPEDFSNMPPWRPGQGYQVLFETPNQEPVIFNYPPEQDQGAAFESATVRDNHWTQPVVTCGNMSVIINAVNGYSLTVDDRIAAFSTDGNLVGLGKVESDGRCGLAVWGDDELTEQVDGLGNGEAFELKLWDADLGEEIDLVTTNIYFGSGTQYQLDDLTMMDVTIQPEIPDVYYLSKAYPNPFNPVTHMTYGMPEAGKVSVKVFDLSGRHVATLAQGNVRAGNHTLTWNAENMVSGVYMVRMEAGQFKAVQKVVLVK